MPTESPTQKPIGDQLRAARELKGWTLAESAKRTKVKIEQLDRLEKNQFDLLPSLAYARGFIRIYARELGLDGWALLRQFNGEVDSGYDVIELQPQDLEAIPKRHQPAAATPQNFGLLVIMGVVFVSLVIAGIQIHRMWPVWTASTPPAPATELAPMVPEAAAPKPGPSAPKPAPVAQVVETAPAPAPRAEVAQPVEAAPAAVPVEVAANPPAAVPVAEPLEDPAAEPSSGANRLQLLADSTSSENERWVRVVGIRNGREITLYEDLLPPGQAIPGNAVGPWTADQFVVTFREAAAVDIIFNGNNYGRYEKSGVQRVSLPAAR